MNDERPPSLWKGMWARFLIGGLLIALLSGAATATIALNTVSGIAAEVFPNTIVAPKGVVTPVYNGGPQTFLVLGSDRRARAKSALDRAVQVFLGGQAGPTTGETLEKQLDNPQVLQAKLDDPRKQVDLGVVAGLVLGAPEFQRR